MAGFMSTNDYVKAACANVVTMLEKAGPKLAIGRIIYECYKVRGAINLFHLNESF